MKLTVDQAIEKAEKARQEGNINDAFSINRIIFRSNPSHAEASHNLGAIQVVLGFSPAIM